VTATVRHPAEGRSVTETATAKNTTGASCRASRIRLRSGSVRSVAVVAPLGDVPCHVIHTVASRGKTAYGRSVGPDSPCGMIAPSRAVGMAEVV